MGAAKIAQDVFLGVAPFLMSDNNAPLRAKRGQTTRHRSVIREPTIAVQLAPICKTPFDVIQSERPLHMERNLDTMSSRQVLINLANRTAQLCFQIIYVRIKLK